MAHKRQSRPDSGLGFQVGVLETWAAETRPSPTLQEELNRTRRHRNPWHEVSLQAGLTWSTQGPSWGVFKGIFKRSCGKLGHFLAKVVKTRANGSQPVAEGQDP